ncbi:hypothetical protein CRENBAI_008552 [Crenichthys baileyi]|uniref:Uncharacterized protein n=1 Tax=Crenichthys baileyi TaxID=28760 RepID=A0AAV9RMU2_9TELE
MSNIVEVKKEQDEPELKQMTEIKEEPEPQSINEKWVELSQFQDEGQLLVKQETNTSMVTPAYEEIFHNVLELQHMMETKKEPQPVQMKEEQEEPEPVQMKEEQEDLCSDRDEEQVVLKQETDRFMVPQAQCFSCSLKNSHSVVWFIHQTGQVQTATNNQDCRENHQS